MNTLLKLINVSYETNSRNNSSIEILRNVNFDIREGEFISLLGPSGCGKSTVVKLIAGLLDPTSGVIETDVDRSNDIAVVFQRPTLLRWRKVLDNLLLPYELRNIAIDDDLKRLGNELIKEMGFLDKELAYYPEQLSIGMQHRLSLARALVLRPKLLILDEPFNSLDIVTKQIIYDLIQEHYKKDKYATLLITHDIDEAVRLSYKIIILSDKPAEIVLEEMPYEYSNCVGLVDKIKKFMKTLKRT